MNTVVPNIRRRALRDGVSRDDIDDAMFEQGCRLINVIPQSESHPGQWIFASCDRSGFLYLVEDGRLDLVYLSAQGRGAFDDLDRLSRYLPFLADEEIAEMAAEPQDEAAFARAIGLTVISTLGEATADQVLVLRRGLDHPSADVRRVALVAVSYAPWPALEDAVARCAALDGEQVLRDLAQQILTTLYG